jgi:hypothetical protein
MIAAIRNAQGEPSVTFRSCLHICSALIGVFAAHPAFAGFVIGSGNEAVIEPPITVPKETPCVVPLYKGAKFGANNVNFTYTPPANCPGPYAKIVLNVGVSLDKGIQYDRTGVIFIGAVPIWFGTTAEPTPQLGPKWSFERDVTDYTSRLATSQTGFVNITNYTNSQDTSIITSHASLSFYPATAQYPAPTVPDLVLPLSEPGGGTAGISGGQSLSATYTLPPNVVNAKLETYLQGQSGDEFWYTCVPNSLTGELESCGGGSVREGELTIDGTPAGVAPVHPYIFTGGIDPYLWSPIPGVQTLDFKPFPIELAPFAGLLSNGQPHTLSLSVFGDNGYFSVTGALFVYLDPNTAQVTGGVTKNTLAVAPTVNEVNNIVAGNTVTGNLLTTSMHDFTINGDVVTSRGTVKESVHQTTAFSNNQTFDITSTLYRQDIKQNTTTVVHTAAISSAGTTSTDNQYLMPITVDIVEKFLKNGDITQKTTVNQTEEDNLNTVVNGAVTAQLAYYDQTQATDLLVLNGSFEIVGNKDMASQGAYRVTSLGAPCFQRVLTAQDNVLTSATTGCSK